MPPEGPLIGSGMKALIAEAAIAADMEHRGFLNYGGGNFVEVGSNANDSNPVVWRITVSDGKVQREMIYGSESDSSVPRVEDYSHLQADVFDYWHKAIDDAFVDWEDFPSANPLGWDKAAVLKGAAEIRVSAHSDDNTGEASGANIRLNADITNLTTRTGQLNGEYAEAFNEKYVAKLRPVLDNLQALTMVLAYSLAGEEELFRRTREQIAQVANDSLKAMQASGPKGGDVTGLKIFLIVVGAVCAGVGAVAAGGVAVPVALKVAASLTGAGASASGGLLGALVKPPPEPDPIPLGADHPSKVLTNLINGLKDINTRIRTEEQLLVELLDATYTDAAPATAAGPFNIAKPELIGKTGSSVLESHQQVLVDNDTIAKITELWIPSIVGDLNACTAELIIGASGWTRPARIGLSATGPWSSYSKLQTGVSDLVKDTATELTGSAESLQAAAADIGLSDEQVNARYAAQARRITEENINY